MKLDQYLTKVRRERTNFKEGLKLAQKFVIGNGGSCEEKKVDETTFYILSLGNDEAFCFLPFPDIDRFYFET